MSRLIKSKEKIKMKTHLKKDKKYIKTKMLKNKHNFWSKSCKINENKYRIERDNNSKNHFYKCKSKMNKEGR